MKTVINETFFENIDDNAIEFYNKYNAEISNSWLNGKLTKKQIANFKYHY